MSSTEGNDPLARLQRLREDAGVMALHAIEPIDAVIREIGVSYRASHFAEDCRDWDPAEYPYYQAHASRFAFAIEVAEGKAAEYALCAARGPDGQHGLCVSVCESHVEDEPRDGGVFHRVVMDRIYTVRPNGLSLALRAQMIDELNQGNFLRAYEEHVREHRENLPSEAVFRYWLPTRKE